MDKNKKEKLIAELDIIAQKGKAIESFEKTDAYKLIVDWVKKESNYERVLTAPKADRDEIIGYVRCGQAFLKQLEIWKRQGERKQKEINKLLEENN